MNAKGPKDILRHVIFDGPDRRILRVMLQADKEKKSQNPAPELGFPTTMLAALVSSSLLFRVRQWLFTGTVHLKMLNIKLVRVFYSSRRSVWYDMSCTLSVLL